MPPTQTADAVVLGRAESPAPRQAVAERVPAVSPLAAVLAAGRLPGLAKALVAAVRGCKAAEKDRYNDFHKYHYASAEAIIEAGRKALGDAGLAVLPGVATLDGSERDGPDRYELRRTFVLLHESGECFPCTAVWPVVPEKGRPLDKATAAADTLSMAYFLRDLLLMPRVDPADDVSARDDRQAAPPAGKRKKAQPPAPSDGAELERFVQLGDERYSSKGIFPKEALIAYMQDWGHFNGVGKEIVRWPAEVIPRALAAAKQFREAEAAKLPPEGDKAPATPPAAPDPHAELVGKAEIAAIQEELKRTATRWRDVVEAPSMLLPKGLLLTNTTMAQYARIMAVLKQTPSVPAGK